MGWFDDRYGDWTIAPDGASASPQFWPRASAPMLQGTPGLLGVGNLNGFGGSDSSDIHAPAGAKDMASAPLSLAPPPPLAVPLPRPRPADAPGADPTSLQAPAVLGGTTSPAAASAASDPSLYDRLSAAAHNFRPAHGIIPGLFDATSGLMTGRRIDPSGQAQQTQNQTVAALQSRGLAPEVAEAVARNPDMMRQAAAQFFGPKQHQHVVVRDAQGNVVPLSFDAASGQYRDANGNPLPPGAFGPPANIPGGGAAAPGRSRYNYRGLMPK